MNSEQTFDNQLNPQPEPPAPQSFFNRLIGVYFSPGEAFKEIGLAPNLLVPMLVLALVGAVGSWVFVDRVGVEKIVGQGIEQSVANGQSTQEQADQRMEGIRKAAPYIKASFPAIGFVASILIILAIAGLAKLVSMMFGVENEFKPLLAVVAYVMLACWIAKHNCSGDGTLLKTG
ncbi:MAG: Yip1 family protein [Blastocatellia bacterium]